MLRHIAVLLAVGTLTAGCAASAAPSEQHHHPEASPGAFANAVSEPAGQITVYADESLTEAFPRLVSHFEIAYPDTKVNLAFGAGATQAQQIVAGTVAGTVADVFVSPDPAAMKRVTDAGAAQGAPTVIARSALVIVVPTANPANVNRLPDLARPGVRVALCAPSAPCGAAARRVIDGAHAAVTPASLEPDAKAVLTKVRSGAVDAGLVYRRDVGTDLRAVDFEQALSVADRYPIIALKAARNPTGAAAFIGFVQSALARRIFTETGFGPP